MSTHKTKLGQSLIECIGYLTGLVAILTVSNIHYTFSPSSRSLALHRSRSGQAVRGTTVQDQSFDCLSVKVRDGVNLRIVPQLASDPIVFSLQSSLLSTILQSQTDGLLVAIDLGCVDVSVITIIH